MITRKRTPGTVCAVQTRRQADNQKPRIRYTKRRHRAAVIIGVPGLDIIKKRGEPRTIAARLIKDRFVHVSILHVADDGSSETSRADQASTRDQLLKLLLNFLLVVGPCFSFGRPNGGA